MAMGQQKDRQGDLMVGWAEMPRSPGHVFYDRLQSVLIEGGFDAFARRAAGPITRPGWARPRCRPGAISACTWWATSRASTQTIPCRFGSSCGLRTGSGCRTIPGCHGPARACLMKFTRRSSTDCRSRSGQGRSYRGGCLDHGGQRGAAQHRAKGHGRGLPGDAGALGPGERYRDAHGRGPGASGPQAQGQEALEPGLGLGATPRPRSPR